MCFEYDRITCCWYECINVYMCVYLRVYVYMYVCVCEYTCLYVHNFIFTNISLDNKLLQLNWIMFSFKHKTS